MLLPTEAAPAEKGGRLDSRLQLLTSLVGLLGLGPGVGLGTGKRGEHSTNDIVVLQTLVCTDLLCVFVWGAPRRLGVCEDYACPL